MHKIALFFPKTAAFHGLRFETKKTTTLNKRQKYKIVWYTPYRCKLFLFVRLTAERRLHPNLARILYLITRCDILLTTLLFCFFYNRDNTKYDFFPRAGDGIAWALCTSMINFISLQTLTHRQSDSTTAGCARTLRNNFISESFCVIFHKSWLSHFTSSRKVRSLIPLKKNDKHLMCLSFFWSGRRDSDPRLPPWQGGILPLNHSRILCWLINTRLSFRRFSKCFLRRYPDAFTYRRKRFSPSNDNS